MNFSRRYMPNAASLQAPLKYIRQVNVKGKNLLNWKDLAVKAQNNNNNDIIENLS